MPGITPVSIGTLVNSFSASFGQPTTAGNLLVAYVATNSSSSTFGTTVTGTGWTLAATGGRAFGWVSIWYRADCGAAESPPAVGGTGSDCWIQFAEFAGAATVSPAGQGTGAIWWSQQAWQAAMPSYDNTGGQLVCSATYWGGGGAVTGGNVFNYKMTDGTGAPVTTTVSSLGNSFAAYVGTSYGVTGIPGSQPDAIVMINTAAGTLSQGAMAAFLPVSPPSAPLTVTTTSLPGTYSNIPYSADINVSGGTPPYTWAITSGSISGSGVSLNAATGALTARPAPPPPVQLHGPVRAFSSRPPARQGQRRAGTVTGTRTAPAPSSPLVSLTPGTYNFTITVTDGVSNTASQPLSLVITAAPPVQASTTWPPTQGVHLLVGASPNLTGIGPLNANFVDPNYWSGDGLSTQNLYVQSLNQWYITNILHGPPGIGQGGVETYPNTGAQFELIPRVSWQDMDFLVSGWDVYMDNDTTFTASATYDLFMDQPLINGGSNLGGAEIMAHFLLINRGSGPYWATDLKFGGYEANGIYVPETSWSLCYKEGFGTAFFQLGGPPGYFNTTQTSGVIDWKPMFQYLVDQQILPASAKLKGFSIGFEICNTQGATRLSAYNNLFWHGINPHPYPVPLVKNRVVTVPARIG